MMSSYHEIWEEEDEDERKVMGGGAKRFLNKARNWVGDLSLEGVVSHQGQQLTYVSQDMGKMFQISPHPSNASHSGLRGFHNIDHIITYF